MKSDSEKMSKVFDLAVSELEQVLDRKKAITDITKIAAGTVANYSRIKSTEIHELGLKLMMEKNGIKELPGIDK